MAFLLWVLVWVWEGGVYEHSRRLRLGYHGERVAKVPAPARIHAIHFHAIRFRRRRLETLLSKLPTQTANRSIRNRSFGKFV